TVSRLLRSARLHSLVEPLHVCSGVHLLPITHGHLVRSPCNGGVPSFVSHSSPNPRFPSRLHRLLYRRFVSRNAPRCQWSRDLHAKNASCSAGTLFAAMS